MFANRVRPALSTLAGAIALGSMTGVAVNAQSIVPDGRTQTTLQTSGTVTDVRTATVQGAVGYNSFDRFNVDAGKVVNLHLPGGTDHLLNLVHNQRTTIDGMLNAVKGGQIGGHVLIANPHGIVVGSQGVVNVGALSLMTPTGAFMDDFFGPGGASSATATSALLDGSAPIASDAVVSVEGVVNTVDDLRIDAGMINVAGSIGTGAVFQSSLANFSDVVNLGGLDGATVAISTAGNIDLRAMGDVDIGGSITRPHGGDDIDPDRIDVVAGDAINMGFDGNIRTDRAEIHMQSVGDLTARDIRTEHGDVEVASTEGNVRVAAIEAPNGMISVSAEQSILDAPNDFFCKSFACLLPADANPNATFEFRATDVAAVDVFLDAEKGTIGGLDDGFHFEVEVANALSAFSESGIHITQLAGDLPIATVRVEVGDVVLTAAGGRLLIHSIEAPLGDVTLAAKDDVVDAVGDGALNVEARRLEIISSEGDIGQLDDPLEIDTKYVEDGGLMAEAKGSVHVTELVGDLDTRPGVASDVGDVYLKALAGDLVIGHLFAEGGTVSVSASGSIVGGSASARIESDNVLLDSGGTIGVPGARLRLEMPHLEPFMFDLNGTVDSPVGFGGPTDDPPPVVEVNFTGGQRSPPPPLGVVGHAGEGVYLREASGGLVIRSLTTDVGDIEVEVTEGDLWIDTLSAPGAVHFAVEGVVIVNGVLSAGSIDLGVGGTLVGTSSSLASLETGGVFLTWGTVNPGSSGAGSEVGAFDNDFSVIVIDIDGTVQLVFVEEVETESNPAIPATKRRSATSSDQKPVDSFGTASGPLPIDRRSADSRRVNREIAVLFTNGLPSTPGAIITPASIASVAATFATVTAPFSDTPLDTGFGAFDTLGIVPVQPLGQPAEPLLTIAE